MEVPPVQSMRVPFKAVPENVSGRAPLAPEGAPPQSRLIWPGRPSAPPSEVEGTSRSDHSARERNLRYQQDAF